MTQPIGPGAPETGEVAQGPAVDRPIIKALREIAYPLAGSARDYDPLMGRIGEARFAYWVKRPTARTSSTVSAPRSPSG
jgi:hypothetical protein